MSSTTPPSSTASASARAVAVQPAGVNLDQLETNLRLGSPAIVGRINHDRFLLDVRTLQECDFDDIVKAVAEAEK